MLEEIERLQRRCDELFAENERLKRDRGTYTATLHAELELAQAENASLARSNRMLRHIVAEFLTKLEREITSYRNLHAL